MTALTTLLDDLDAKVKAATPGPLVIEKASPYVVRDEDRNTVAHHCGESVSGRMDRANAALHVAAVNAAPILSRIVRAAVELREVKSNAWRDASNDPSKREELRQLIASAFAILDAALDDAEAEAAR